MNYRIRMGHIERCRQSPRSFLDFLGGSASASLSQSLRRCSACRTSRSRRCNKAFILFTRVGWRIRVCATMCLIPRNLWPRNIKKKNHKKLQVTEHGMGKMRTIEFTKKYTHDEDDMRDNIRVQSFRGLPIKPVIPRVFRRCAGIKFASSGK